MKNIIKEGICPKCKRVLIRKRTIRIKNVKPTKCGSCKFVIENPYEVFKPQSYSPK